MFRRRPPKIYDDDDGRVIANMNIEGMPGYNPDRADGKPSQEPLDLTREEKRAITWGMLKAGFLVAGIVAVVYLLLILFLLFIWRN